MLKELVQYLVDSATVKEIAIGNCTYTSKKVELIQDPMPAALVFNTLSGFVDFTKQLPTDGVMIHIKSHNEVYLRSLDVDSTNQRAVFAKSNLEMHGTQFRFGEYLDIEQPSSEFLFRVRSAGEGKAPLPGLFEADGGTWMLQAIQSIAKHLKEQCPGYIVLA